MKHERFTKPNEFDQREPASTPTLGDFSVEVTYYDEKERARLIRHLTIDRILAQFR